MKDVSWHRALAVALVAAVWFAGCYAEGSDVAGLGTKGRGRLSVDAGTRVSTPDTGSPVPPDTGGISALCLPAKSSESLPARGIAMDANAVAEPEAVFASYLYSRFVVLCGGCHVSQASGGFQVNAGTFKDLIDQADEPSLARITSDDPDKFMPPPPLGKAYKDRQPNDPVRQFAERLDLWIKKGKPNVFYIDPDPAQTGGSQYLMSPDLGKALTNIGSCIPDKSVIGIETDEMKRLDKVFADVKTFTDLPKTLDGTDMVSFDAEKLARYGVIGFAPAYPLFSDKAKKMRYVRTPVGTHIAFDPKTKEFTVPENTRFYKTFVKRVIDQDGNESYRKMETRIVLARADTVLGADAGAAAGTTKVNAIFATWKWKPDERSAELVTTPYNDGSGFADDVAPYDTDEQKAAAINADPSIKNKDFELRNQGVVRNYGIPGSDRCLQCHMGSPARAGVLGFTPLQIDRRKTGEGGTYEETGPDELTQLERLIDYGVITGMTGPQKEVSLEASQTEPPRNDHELNAQAYMVGNCGFCHNPHGYPTVQNPELRDKLNFWPSQGGGIFHFPLDRMSPRIHRGDTLDTDIPYITPSLYDLPRSVLTDAKQVDQNSQNAGSYSLPNWYLAPWRSLIYRNTDTPFTYTDDNAIFPHMPMNVPGYDCRVPRIMAEWMISIPARWKAQKYNDDWSQDGARALIRESCPTSAVSDNPVCATSCDDFPCGRRNLPELDRSGKTIGYHSNEPDMEPQPYEEVLPTDADYDSAKTAAESRLAQYRADERYKFYCPDDQAGSDIVDNTIPEHPKDPVPLDDTWFDVQDGKNAYQWIVDGVPDRAHWVITDITQPPGDWEPRRSDWKKVLFDEDIGARPTDTIESGLKWDRLVPVVHMLSAKNPNPPRLTAAFRTFATTKRPMGLWTKTDCTYTDQGQPKVSSVSPKPDWFTAAGTVPPAPDARVYMQSPGSFVFTQVCSNCHGRLADSNGRLASKILELTGGNARVASFRDGLFGPVATPSKYRNAVFDREATKSASDSFIDGDDLASRYMAFMGLGGTTKVIPQSLLSVVGLTPVFGTPRENGKATDANMLSIARLLCSETLPFRNGSETATFDVKTGRFDVSFPSLQEGNGDGQLWREMCNFGNPSPVRALELHPTGQVKVVFAPTTAFYSRAAFTSTDPVGDLYGNVKLGVTDADLQPWCLKLEDETPATLAAAEAWWETNRKNDQQVLPKCPPAAVLSQHEFDAGTVADGPDWIAWVDRGAANAGFAVFAYLDDLTQGKTQPADPFNGCPSAAK